MLPIWAMTAGRSGPKTDRNPTSIFWNFAAQVLASFDWLASASPWRKRIPRTVPPVAVACWRQFSYGPCLGAQRSMLVEPGAHDDSDPPARLGGEEALAERHSGPDPVLRVGGRAERVVRDPPEAGPPVPETRVGAGAGRDRLAAAEHVRLAGEDEDLVGRRQRGDRLGERPPRGRKPAADRLVRADREVDAVGVDRQVAGRDNCRVRDGRCLRLRRLHVGDVLVGVSGDVPDPGDDRREVRPEVVAEGVQRLVEGLQPGGADRPLGRVPRALDEDEADDSSGVGSRGVDALAVEELPPLPARHRRVRRAAVDEPDARAAHLRQRPLAEGHRGADAVARGRGLGDRIDRGLPASVLVGEQGRHR